MVLSSLRFGKASDTYKLFSRVVVEELAIVTGRWPNAPVIWIEN